MDQKNHFEVRRSQQYLGYCISVVWGCSGYGIMEGPYKVFNNAFLTEEQGCDNFVVVYIPVNSFVIQDQNSSIET